MKTTFHLAPARHVQLPLFRREWVEFREGDEESDLLDHEGTFGPQDAFPDRPGDRREPRADVLLAAWIGMRMP